MRLEEELVRTAAEVENGCYAATCEQDEELPAALVSAMNEAGVTFVKLGQVLSSREDVLPPVAPKGISVFLASSIVFTGEVCHVTVVLFSALGLPM